MKRPNGAWILALMLGGAFLALSTTAQAWWGGPYGGPPYWGGPYHAGPYWGGPAWHNPWGGWGRPASLGPAAGNAFSGFRFQEKKDGIVVTGAIPGADETSIEATVERGMLKIAAQRRVDQAKQESDNRSRTMQRAQMFSRFEQRMPLPMDVNPEGLTTKYENGVLTVTIPKKVKAPPPPPPKPAEPATTS